MQNKKHILILAMSGIALSLMLSVPTLAATSNTGSAWQGGRGVHAGTPGIFGKVSAINGTAITVTSKARPNGGTATTYTVDASAATVSKNGQTSTVSAIAVGDTVMIQGTISGTNIAAKTIRDGIAQPAIQGNGQPVVAGTVTSVNGTTIAITNQSNVSYTIDASNAKFSVRGITNPTISNITTGDNIIVQGTVNGNSVAASSVIDQKSPASNNGNTTKPNFGFMGGVMNNVTNFFKHLFGF
jgi:hypothetical protein